MTVQLADTPLTSAFALSETGRLVLGLIDGGLHWLDYAISASYRTYGLPDESTLVAAVQSGLHANRLMLLGGVELPVAPVKLMTMNPRELQILRRAALGQIDPEDPQVEEILSRHSLATIQDLAAVDAMLDHLEIADDPLFQTMTLDERLTLLALQTDDRIADPGKPDLRLEAAQFALDQAGSPVEFADYLRVFLDLMRNLDDPFETPEERYEQAERAVYTLGPIMLAALDCPDACIPRIAAGTPDPSAQPARHEWYAAREGLAAGGGGAARIDATRRALERVAQPFLPPENPAGAVVPNVAQARLLIAAAAPAPAVLANLKNATCPPTSAPKGHAPRRLRSANAAIVENGRFSEFRAAYILWLQVRGHARFASAMELIFQPAQPVA